MTYLISYYTEGLLLGSFELISDSDCDSTRVARAMLKSGEWDKVVVNYPNGYELDWVAADFD